MAEPLWYNDKFNNPYLFFESWARHNVLYIKDFIKEDGTLLKFEDFKQKWHIKGTILDFNRVLQNIPTTWLEKLRANNESINLYDNILNMNLRCILKQTKGCRNIYDLLSSNSETSNLEIKAHGKWETELGHQILNWHKIYSIAYHCTSDTKLQDFQYRIINRILTTNASLLKFGIADSEMCSFCH